MIETSVNEGIYTIRIDRPEVKNAISADILHEVRDSLADLDTDKHDVCIMTGTGDAFSSGGDVEAMADREETPLESYERLHRTLTPVIEDLVTTPVPTVARVNGDAVGAGANLAFAADFVIANEDARFGEPFVHVGLIPDGGGTVFLPHYVGLRTAKELTMTGRLFSAEEAADLGLINDAVPADTLDQAVDEIVSELASKPTDIIGLTKRALHENLGRPFRDGLEREANYQTLAYGTPAHERGIERFLEK